MRVRVIYSATGAGPVRMPFDLRNGYICNAVR